jgi:hypothetical protein
MSVPISITNLYLLAFGVVVLFLNSMTGRMAPFIAAFFARASRLPSRPVRPARLGSTHASSCA